MVWQKSPVSGNRLIRPTQKHFRCNDFLKTNATGQQFMGWFNRVQTSPCTIVSPLYNSRAQRGRRRIFSVVLALLFVTALLVPAVAARDVKIALPELRPSAFTDEQGNPAGLLVDIVTDVAAKEGWTIIWVKGSLQESWTRLAAGEIDLLMGVAETPERQVLYDFNREPVLSAWSQVYARPGSGISTVLDLEGKRVALLRGDINGIEFQDYAKKFDINVTYLEKDSLDEAFRATAAGDADAMVGFSLASEQSANRYNLAGTPVMFNPSSLVFAVPKGKNADILSALDRYITEGKADPTSSYSQTLHKWFGMTGTSGIIPSWFWGGLAGIACLAGLFVIMSVILRREVRRKTAELSRQNENLQSEIASRMQAEIALKNKNQELFEAYTRLTATEEELRQNYQELNAAYEQLTSTEEELRQNYQELRKSEQALMQARKKLSSLNALTFEDIRNAVFSLDGFITLAKQESRGGKADAYLGKSMEILQGVRNSMQNAKKYQDLGIHPPRWHNVNITLINAVSHLDLSQIRRSVKLDGLEIYADPLLEDVFFILIQNILIHGEGATEVTVRYRKDPGSLVITISDNGPGIPDADKERIFDRDYMTTAKSSGLFLAREILSLTGITIRETGARGSGARFEILVPEGTYRFPSSK